MGNALAWKNWLYLNNFAEDGQNQFFVLKICIVIRFTIWLIDFSKCGRKACASYITLTRNVYYILYRFWRESWLFAFPPSWSGHLIWISVSTAKLLRFCLVSKIILRHSSCGKLLLWWKCESQLAIRDSALVYKSPFSILATNFSIQQC